MSLHITKIASYVLTKMKITYLKYLDKVSVISSMKRIFIIYILSYIF